MTATPVAAEPQGIAAVDQLADGAGTVHGLPLATREELGYWRLVGSRFAPWRGELWLGVLHDAVEHGDLPKVLLAGPALDAITRREGQEYVA